MSQSAGVVPNQTPVETSQPSALKTLPDFGGGYCSPQIAQKLDLMLLALEALQLGGSELMLRLLREQQLAQIIGNRVFLWRSRCTNPWRRSYARRQLKRSEAKALTVVTSQLAQRLTAVIRQLLLAQQTLAAKDLPLHNHYRLSAYLTQFRAHFRSRMNSRRAKIADYISTEEKLNQLALNLLQQLLFCTGTAGTKRLWISLFDGEVR
ncbi:MAG: DUF3038 domain-containing protein [Cyanobacteria bacterium P01_H01_bin.15]